MAHLLDPRQPLLADNPAEWPDVPEALRGVLLRPNPVMDGATRAALDRLLRARWFFIRNRGNQGESYRCARCKRIHDFFTLHCIPRPFNGLTQVVMLLEQRGADPQETDYYAKVLGMVEPITRARARAHFRQLVLLGYPADELLGAGGARYSLADLALLDGRG